jgi:PAS domain S-box-containing protein
MKHLTQQISPSPLWRVLTEWLLRHPRRGYILIALCVALPLGLFVYVMHRRLLTHAEQMTVERNRQVTVLASVLVQDRLQQSIVFLQSLATRPSLLPLLARRQSAAIAEQLAGAYSIHGQFRFLAVVGLDGLNIGMHPYYPELQGKEFKFRDWYQGVTRTQQPYVSNPYRSLVNEREVVVGIAVPVHDQSGRMVAIMIGVVPLDAVRSWVDQLGSSMSTNVVVIASDGKPVASSNPDLLGSASLLELEPVRYALGGKEGNGRYLIGSTDFLVSYAPISRQRWGVLTMVPYRAISGGVGAFTLSSVALLGAIMTCTLTATGVIMSLLRQLHISEANAATAHRTVKGILDSALQVGIIAVDGDGVITMFNPGAERMLGYSAEELVGKQTPALFHLRDEMEKRAEDLTRKLGVDVQGFDVFTVEARKGLASISEWTYVRKDGSTLTVELSVNSRTDAEGKVMGFMGIATDITERKLHLDKIERQNAELALRNQEVEHANRMKSQFLASMSHDLRTPLNSILGFSELLAEQAIGALNEKQARFVEHIRNSGRHLLDLINDVLDLSKIEAGQLQLARAHVAVRAALEQVEADVQPQLKTKRLQFTQNAPDVSVLADPTGYGRSC